HTHLGQILRSVFYLYAAKSVRREKGAVELRCQPDSRESRIARVALDLREMRLEVGPKLGVSLIPQVGRLVDRHRETVTARVLALRTNTLKLFRILRSQTFSRAQFSHR